MNNLPKMLSLHGLSQQCQLLEKVYNKIAKELRSTPGLLNYVQKFVTSEAEKRELSMTSRLLLLDVKTGKIHDRHNKVSKVIESPLEFKKQLKPEEETIMEYLDRFSNISQIFSEIKNLSMALQNASADDAADALEKAAKRLMKKAIEIERLLA